MPELYITLNQTVLVNAISRCFGMQTIIQDIQTVNIDMQSVDSVFMPIQKIMGLRNQKMEVKRERFSFTI